MDYKEFFKNKKITVMGLGLLGRGIGDIEFLANQEGVEIIVTDLKSEEDLKESVEKLKKYKNIKFVLGEHRKEDFQERDIVIKAAGVPKNSPYLKGLKNVYMSTALFAKFSSATIVGITGTRGKSTVSYLIFEILKKAGKKAFLGGNIKGLSTLAHLPESTDNEIAVLELDSWQLQGFGDLNISPHISVFTNLMPDHLNYYKSDIDLYFEDKANIFKNQKEKDFLVLGEDVVKIVDKKYPLEDIKSKVFITSHEDFPKDWKIKIPGEHNKYNAACAIEVAKVLNIEESFVKKAVEDFRGAEGRLEFIKEIEGVKIYNDTNATTPEATLSGLKAVSEDRNVILIMGGADKEIDMKKLIDEIPNYCKKVILLPGTGTEKIRESILGLKFLDSQEVSTLEKAVNEAVNFAENGDIVLFSPAFASFGMFKNEYDRGEKFLEIIKRYV